MATISSPGVGSNGLDVKGIISQLVALERRPLDALKLQAATVNTKISAYGQIKSLVATLADATGALTSVTGWNGVNTTSSDPKYVSATALGGSLPTSFSVEVQSLAKAQATASAALLPVGGALRAGTLRLELGQWSLAPASFTPASGQPVDIRITAGDKLADVASKINGAGAGVSASILSDASGERLLLRSKNTGQAAGFRLSLAPGTDTTGNAPGAIDLSRLVVGSTVTQAGADAKATVNGIPVTSASNDFTGTVAGVSFQALQVTTAPIDITVSKDQAAIGAHIDSFVKAYNAINQVLQEATKYDAKTHTAGLLQGDATALGLQNALRRALQSVTSSGGAFQRLADVGITQQLGGDLAVDTARLNRALTDAPDDVKNLFRHTGGGGGSGGGGAADGIAVQLKALTTELLSNTGYFNSKDDTLQRSLARNSEEQTRVNQAADAFEKQITQRYNTLDTQLSKLNGLNAYITQQVSAWNKSGGQS